MLRRQRNRGLSRRGGGQLRLGRCLHRRDGVHFAYSEARRFSAFFGLKYRQIQASLSAGFVDLDGASQDILTDCRGLAIACGEDSGKLWPGPTAIRLALMAGEPCAL